MINKTLSLEEKINVFTVGSGRVVDGIVSFFTNIFLIIVPFFLIRLFL